MTSISVIMLLKAIEAMYPGKRLIHLFGFSGSGVSGV
jgi:hypothetical protein